MKVNFINLSAPTPQVMFTVKSRNLPYGAAITASHNPALYNGIKLFIREGRDAPQEVTDAIQAEANALSASEVRPMDFEAGLKRGSIAFIDPRDSYLDSILEKIDTNAIRRRRPRIVLDPMYGVSLTGLLTILYSARCDVDVIHDTHDAFFGRRLPAPTIETLADLQRQVIEHNADLGIATDGDADRLGVIDERGRYVSANEIIVLLYHYLLKYKGWRGAVVRNVATTQLLDRVAGKFGEKCIEVPVGFEHISSAMRANDALIGGESSGGLTVRGHIFGKDGLYAASLLVEMLSVTGKPLSRHIQDIFDEFGELRERTGLRHAHLLGQRGNRRLVAHPDDIVDGEVVAEDNRLVRVEVDDGRDVGDGKSEEIEEIAVLTEVIGIVGIVHRGFMVAQKHGDTVLDSRRQFLSSVLINLGFE